MEQLMSTVVPAPHESRHQGNPVKTFPTLHRRGVKKKKNQTTTIWISASTHVKLSTKLALYMRKYKSNLYFRGKKHKQTTQNKN